MWKFKRAPLVEMVCPSCKATVMPQRSRLAFGRDAFCPDCGGDIPIGFKPVFATYTYATHGRRIVALFVDWLPLFLAALATAAAASNSDLDYDFEDVAGYWLGAWLVLLVPMLAVQIPHILHGTTLGKSIVGLKVVKTDGERAGVIRVLIRETVAKTMLPAMTAVGTYGPDAMLWLLVPGLWMTVPLYDRNRQAPHDMIVSTVVVENRVPPPTWSKACFVGVVIIQIALSIAYVAGAGELGSAD